MAYQSLYRRYRSQTFDQVLGQGHVTTALKNSVREDRVAHGYLFSGPRGTGKTSTARILAKVLNCENPVDGEPDTTCDNCKAVEEGRQVDWLQELDAASNSGVDAMRDLLGRVTMGTSGNRKVYILDEVHMLTKAASNALLKTLEEPPAHVVFVLATTEPEKVLPTIRSRTQHFDFHLLGADVLADHVRHVIADADLGLDESAVEHVVRVGAGSARDTLSALDQVAATGGVSTLGIPVDDIIDALGARDAGAALVAVDASVRAGRDPRLLAEALIEALRDAFLVAMGAPAGQMTDAASTRAGNVAAAMGPASLTRALELIGTASVDMRQAPDPRITLEVALVRLTRSAAGDDVGALVARIEHLEQRLASGAAPAAAPVDASPADSAAPAPTAPPPATVAPSSGRARGAARPDPKLSGSDRTGIRFRRAVRVCRRRSSALRRERGPFRGPCGWCRRIPPPRPCPVPCKPGHANGRAARGRSESLPPPIDAPSGGHRPSSSRRIYNRQRRRWSGLAAGAPGPSEESIIMRVLLFRRRVIFVGACDRLQSGAGVGMLRS
ncbi:MAG: DNA polymerase III subunit gamma/tau [Acidimicrobiales bacterium]|nr:DNA polymerase III subunit gamma/tau [Acidimicrobiales bacterium]